MEDEPLSPHWRVRQGHWQLGARPPFSTIGALHSIDSRQTCARLNPSSTRGEERSPTNTRFLAYALQQEANLNGAGGEESNAREKKSESFMRIGSRGKKSWQENEREARRCQMRTKNRATRLKIWGHLLTGRPASCDRLRGWGGNSCIHTHIHTYPCIYGQNWFLCKWWRVIVFVASDWLASFALKPTK